MAGRDVATRRDPLELQDAPLATATEVLRAFDAWVAAHFVLKRDCETCVRFAEAVEALRVLLEHERTLVREVAAFQSFQRFHAFDAVRDDRCPACGGAVRVIETENAVRLEATRS